ncbi:radical SAM protein [Candidatus Woesearchaeota archaeon]|nr:radical SAM protein [Candidatus Woesearchaeota archaeon]
MDIERALTRAVAKGVGIPLMRAGLYTMKPSIWGHHSLLEEIALRAVEANPSLTRRLIASYLKTLPSKMWNRIEFNSRNGFWPPNSLIVNPGDYCQLSCDGCVTDQIRVGEKKVMSYETMTRSAEQIMEIGGRMMIFMGGDPLHPKQEQNVMRVIDENPSMVFTLFTNGVNLQDHHIETFMKRANTIVMLSTDGLYEVNDAIRCGRPGGKGSFEYIEAAADRLHEHNLPFALSASVRQSNADNISSDEFMRFFADRGAIAAFFVGYIPTTGDYQTHMLRQNQLGEFSERLADAQLRTNIMLFNYANLTNMYGCRAGLKHLYVEADGAVSPCFALDVAFGNINKDSLDEILSVKFASFRKMRENLPYSACIATTAADAVEMLAQKEGLAISPNVRTLVQIQPGLVKGGFR